MCQMRVRERDRLVRGHERAVALARGDRGGSFVDGRAVLGHSIVDRSTRRVSLVNSTDSRSLNLACNSTGSTRVSGLDV